MPVLDNSNQGCDSTISLLKKQVKRVIKYLLRLARPVLFFVPKLIIKLIIRIFNIRFLKNTNFPRIGHLCAEPDCYIKEGLLGLHPKYFTIAFAPENSVANAHLLKYWSKYIQFITNPSLCRIIKRFIVKPEIEYDVQQYCVAINQTADAFKIQALWGDRPPLLTIKSEDVIRGEDCLKKMGLPPGLWFICVHSREGGYSPSDEHYHSFRNSEIENYFLAMNEIAKRGGWCIRMGDPSMKKLPAMNNVIDYAHSVHRADWLDLYIAARCKFFLGNSSGAFGMASIFGVPVATVNMAPLSATLPYGIRDIGIPKLLREKSSGKMLTFREVLSSPLGDARYAEIYEREGIELLDNTPEDVLDLTLEQLERVNGTIQYTDEDERLQQQFKSLMHPGHYTYGSASRIGRGFLRKYRHLF